MRYRKVVRAPWNRQTTGVKQSSDIRSPHITLYNACAELTHLLVGASGQSVYAWEQGKARPRGKNLAAIAALRGVGKREVVERLAALKSGEQS